MDSSPNGPALYEPDFKSECYECGRTPCVRVVGHRVEKTQLCGVCLFSDRLMVDWQLWNERSEDLE